MKKYLDRVSRREQIARAALTILGTDGLPALSMRCLATKVGLVPSAVYRHFHNKEDVLDAAFEVVEKKLSSMTQRAMNGSEGPEERLHCLLLDHLRLVVEQPGVARLVFGSFAFSDDVSRRERVRVVIENYLSSVRSIIRKGQRDGILRKDVSAKSLAVLFLGLIQPAVILHHVTDKEFSPIKHAQKVWSPFITGLRRQEDGN